MREKVETKPKLYTENARDVIVRADAASYSTLKHFERSALHAREHMLNPKDSTPAMELGNATHLAILEPARFDAEVAVAPKIDKRTAAGKQEWAAFQADNFGKTLLTEDEWAQCDGMRQAVWGHETAAALLSGKGHNELGAVWGDEETGEPCKALIDRMGEFDGWTWALDVKTTRDATPREFVRSVANLHYDAQAAMILDGLATLAPRERRFAWIAVESAPPHGVAVYEADLTILASGRAKWHGWLRKYAQSKQTGVWPGYPTGVRTLTLPKWAFYEEPNE